MSTTHFPPTEQKPSEIVSSYEALLVRFSTDGTMSSKGFAAAYVAVDPVDGIGYIGGGNANSQEDSYPDSYENATPFPGSLRSMYVQAPEPMSPETNEDDVDETDGDSDTGPNVLPSFERLESRRFDGERVDESGERNVGGGGIVDVEVDVSVDERRHGSVAGAGERVDGYGIGFGSLSGLSLGSGSHDGDGDGDGDNDHDGDREDIDGSRVVGGNGNGDSGVGAGGSDVVASGGRVGSHVGGIAVDYDDGNEDGDVSHEFTPLNAATRYDTTGADEFPANRLSAEQFD